MLEGGIHWLHDVLQLATEPCRIGVPKAARRQKGDITLSYQGPQKGEKHTQATVADRSCRARTLSEIYVLTGPPAPMMQAVQRRDTASPFLGGRLRDGKRDLGQPTFPVKMLNWVPTDRALERTLTLVKAISPVLWMVSAPVVEAGWVPISMISAALAISTSDPSAPDPEMVVLEVCRQECDQGGLGPSEFTAAALPCISGMRRARRLRLGAFHHQGTLYL